MAGNQHLYGELCLIDKNITSLLEIPVSEKLRSLSLHCNRIVKIEGLALAWQLRHLDLSSNRITRIEGLDSLTSLHTLNLSCNLITKVEGLNCLVNLIRLNLSYNQISDLTGLLYLHGTGHKLRHLNLHSNQVCSINQVLQCMVGLQNLTELTFSMDGKDNPVCLVPGYREIILQSLPQMVALDGVNRKGEPMLADCTSINVPGLEDFVDFLVSSDTSGNAEKPNSNVPIATPSIDKVLTQFHQRNSTGVDRRPKVHTGENSLSEEEKTKPNSCNLYNELRIKKLEHQVSQLFHQVPSSSSSTPSVVRKAKRDIDYTSESECDSAKENNKKGSRRSRIPKYRSANKTTGKRLTKDTPGKRSDSEQDITAKGPKKTACLRKEVSFRTSQHIQPLTIGSQKKKGLQSQNVSSLDTRVRDSEETTYRAIIEERDQERERRWKAEQAVKKLTETLKNLQVRATEEKDLQNMALYTTDRKAESTTSLQSRTLSRLKELLLKEKEEKSKLQASVEELMESNKALVGELRECKSREEQQQRSLHSLEDSLAKREALRAQQQAEEMKKNQELEFKVAALKREVDILRASVRQHKEKLQQVHELLASKEQVHRKELESRVTLTGPEFREALAREVAVVEQRHSHQVTELQEKMAAIRQQYSELEDEFRMALTIEATRFKEVKEGFDHVSAELLEHKRALAKFQQKEKRSAVLVQDLTAMVKEQKARIAELVKSKQESVSELKSQIRSLEAVVEEDKKQNVQIELLKRDKSKLISQLTAQESVIDGLRAERRIWGQELAQQGASLAQDRGRLEARIEVLSGEIESLKKQSERDNDALKIKAKIVEDQTETIRKLKEAVQERDEQIKKLREEILQAQKAFREQLEEERGPVLELREQVEQLTYRKDELKQHLVEKETELHEVKKAYSAMNKKWQDKAELLTHLEAQVKHMKANFDAKEKRLIEEKEMCLQRQKDAVGKLHSIDDAFRRQLESVQTAHQAELLHLATEKQKQIEEANQKVFQVEGEMRQLLEETASSKRAMEEKMRRLTSVLRDFQQL
uniref:Leucine-rich repeat and coiled-coil domain-containing protein 1 n=1 Tax=Lepisosteus oculatus TaxID=7918 RepID=W5N538_LEPOC|nr:PREDICTED: leucine-rich repeat and coiled-coil domain-containing protein 1 isoform X2 [Lepisosteus oculatus]